MAQSSKSNGSPSGGGRGATPAEMKKVRTFRTIERKDDSWKPEAEGDSAEGILVKSEVVATVNGNRDVYTFAVEGLDPSKPESLFRVWGTRVLSDLLGQVSPGSFVRMTYNGLGKDGKTKLFTVEVAEA